MYSMSDVIAEYQRWKQQGGELRAKARVAMEARFRELLTEAARVSEEYHADFGGTLKPPAMVTAFRFKSGKAKKAAVPKKAEVVVKKAAVAVKKAAAPVQAAKPDPKIKGLEKQLAAARKKLEAAQAAGKPTRDLDDRIYEIEDAIKVATDTES
jgi:hypothetical protein